MESKVHGHVLQTSEITSSTCVSLDIIHPRGYMCECVKVGDVIGDDDTMCPSVVALSDCPEPLLACRVPYL